MNTPPNIFTSLDLEMNQPSGTIIQIGAVVGNIETKEVLEKLSIIVHTDEIIREDIVKLTKIKQEDVDAGISLIDAYEKLKNMHRKHKCFINPLTWGGGDSLHLKQELGKCSSLQDWCFGRRWIDTKTLYISWRLANKHNPQGGLSRAMKNLGLNFKGQAHDACWDAENTFYAYCALIKLLQNKN